jgi:hypothetical protein
LEVARRCPRASDPGPPVRRCSRSVALDLGRAIARKLKAPPLACLLENILKHRLSLRCRATLSAAFAALTSAGAAWAQQAPAAEVDNGTNPTMLSRVLEAKYEYLNLGQGVRSGALRLNYAGTNMLPPAACGPVLWRLSARPRPMDNSRHAPRHWCTQPTPCVPVGPRQESGS